MVCLYGLDWVGLAKTKGEEEKGNKRRMEGRRHGNGCDEE